jgi:hypothetical protein
VADPAAIRGGPPAVDDVPTVRSLPGPKLVCDPRTELPTTMPSNVGYSVSFATLCLLIVLSGCGGVPSAGQPTDAPTATDSPLQPTETLTATTEAPSTTADSPPDPTPSPTTVLRGGLLVVDIVGTETGTNASDPVRYDQATFNRSPILDDAVAEAVSTNATQRRDLSGREVRRVESVADAYDRSISELAVSKNGTVVRVSLAYEA